MTTALDTALAFLDEGLWPVPVTAPDDPDTINPGKAPIGTGWGVKKHTPSSLGKIYEANPGAGVGLKLGPEGGVIDIDVDDPKRAAPVIERMFGGEVPETRGWSSARGHHWLSLWDDRLSKYGKAIVKNHPHYPGVELRFGWSTEKKQYQSVTPPSVGADGKARVWNEFPEIRALPESFFADLDKHLAPEPVPPPRPRQRGAFAWDPERRARSYLQKCEPAIEGQDGSGRCFKAACKIGPGFDLPADQAFQLLRDIYNPTCVPPWSEKELRHKVEDSYKTETRRGWLLNDPPKNGHTHEHTNGEAKVNVPGPSPEFFDDPFRLARSFLETSTAPDDYPTLRYWLEEWHQWDGTKYVTLPPAEVRASITSHVKREFDLAALGTEKPPARVTTGIISNTLLALSGLCLLTHRNCRDRPAWLDYQHEDLPFPKEVIATPNGLIHLPALVEGRDGVLPPTPRFFSPNCLGYNFDPESPRPDRWLDFLDSVWGDDPQTIQALQEWFGYLLTPDTSQQKILVVIGPTRSGKGTIAKTLTRLVGEANVASPTLSGMASNFGVAPLIGKMVAIFPDARLSGRADGQVIVERLLSVSGEDNQEIDRKHLSCWSGRLTSRFVLISNELPRLGDSSGAITARTVILRLTKSFLGREDTTLHDKIAAELPSILLWSIAGWARLRRRGRFLQPESGLELVEEMKELASPIGSFLDERVEYGSDLSTSVKDLYASWKAFCTERGRDHPGDEQGFGRMLRAALPMLKMKRKNEDGSRTRVYVGIGVKIDFR